ncbi:ABC-type polysaccharide/polyol phosphate transport system, ATPase component [Xenococcus sp. PCC 7305]|uniref:ABC transporter ATP-binding protein n=1 Tax=Xenococcus sp. PCC 7305 TaxID=102125 RepID=UPI0002AC5C5F|nr:ABC transporter ATP-binding protein [Xenococcus sp. PCC 7305]ELS03919.1 ABC-type polysaccharide/polyol phosphate transport system, ATPase component [Xenococcus sp. PCC 7305]
MTEAIRLDKVSLWRRTQEEFSYDLKRTILSVVEGKYRQPAKKLILNEIELTINRGEKIAIIGSNGSGKSTLLKVICGILRPTTGSVKVRGNIAPLIELGAGFDEELSVLDNIIFYGVMLGFSRQEMKERAKSILEFAELQEYGLIPVKSLSSGMKARLGFAIATDVEPDILILDEILSVGDEGFKHKCEQKMQEFWQDGITILLVSHSMSLIAESCKKAIWLDHGQIKFMGDTEQAIELYLKSY